MRVLRANLFPYIVAYIPLIFPLYLFKGEFAGIPLTLPEILIYLCFAVFIFKEGLYRISWKILPLALFIFTAILSALIVPDVLPYIDGSEYPARLKALGILKGWIFVPILYFTMARFYFREKAGLVTVAMQALLLSGLFLSSNAVYQALTETATTIDGRISGPFESANYTLVLWLFMQFFHFWKRKKGVKKYSTLSQDFSF
jgi:hypothetical protein